MLVGYQSRPIAARAGRGVGGAALDVRGSKFALADTDAARERSGIVIDTVVGDFEEMRPTVHKDPAAALGAVGDRQPIDARGDRKSTRLNSSHGYISYAVFCLKTKTMT